MTTGAIILSAGSGRRIAKLGIKPLLKIDGKTFLEIIIDKLEHSGFTPIVVVVNPTHYAAMITLRHNAQLCVNQHHDLGMLSSLRCGLSHIEKTTQGFMLHPVDFPLVKPETYDALMAAHHRHDASIVKPTFEGRHGHPVIFPRLFYHDLTRAPLSEGARWVQRQHPEQVVSEIVNDPGILININTPELYGKYCAKQQH
ncbi:MAG: nucleotidyltransferase family protein [candidate division KSB1 bacterium]|jgi:CTP:molybdopterin cytidylyltransferase MocA|nr:nucleotidyltransferase family protein [candidate division KSB1 bacterium]